MAQTRHLSSFERFSPSPIHPFTLSRDFSIPRFNVSTPTFKTLSFPRNLAAFHFPGESGTYIGKIQLLNAWNGERTLTELDDSPVSVELVPISSETQFDRIIAEAQQLDGSVIIVWMASWCRKCIYLKPKLEKLAADYYPRLRFYCIDVNNVPHKLVAHAGVTKMPTIQVCKDGNLLNEGFASSFFPLDGLWKDGKKQSEVIGGHKAHFVINEVRQMIENVPAL